MKSFVIDANIFLAYVLKEWSEYANTIVEQYLENWCVVHVPLLWHIEVRNILVLKVQKNIITESYRDLVLGGLEGLLLQTDIRQDSRYFALMTEIAQSQKLTTYDATYLELALRLWIPLATMDSDLIKAAKNIGVEIFAV